MMKLWVVHDSGMYKFEVPTVTLTFDLAATWFLHTTHRLDDHFGQKNFNSHQFSECSYGLDRILECTNLNYVQIPPCMMY